MPNAVGSSKGGIATQAKYGRVVAARAHLGLVAKFERMADPDGELPEAERKRRGRLLMRAHMRDLAKKSAASRRKTANAKVRRPQPEPELQPLEPRPLWQVSKTLGTRLQKYGLLLEDYEDLLHRQGGVCALCKSPPARDKSLCIDHCHDSGRVRGLLCNRCNSLLGGYEALADNAGVDSYLAPDPL